MSGGRLAWLSGAELLRTIAADAATPCRRIEQQIEKVGHQLERALPGIGRLLALKSCASAFSSCAGV